MEKAGKTVKSARLRADGRLRPTTSEGFFFSATISHSLPEPGVHRRTHHGPGTSVKCSGGASSRSLCDLNPLNEFLRSRIGRRGARREWEWEVDSAQPNLKAARQTGLSDERAIVRGVEVTGELYDLILFCVHSFVRPTSTELYALKHNDIHYRERPKATARDRAQWQDGLSGCQHDVRSGLGLRAQSAIPKPVARTTFFCPTTRTEQQLRGSSSASSIS